MTAHKAFVTLVCLHTLCAGTVGPSAGAQQILNGPNADRPLAWRFDRQWTAGGADDDDLQFQTLYPRDIAADLKGRLLVVDRTGYRVRILDQNGKRVAAVGGRGGGPGEFDYPLGVNVGVADAIHVYDSHKNKIVVFGADGAVRPEYRLPGAARAWHLIGNNVVYEHERKDSTSIEFVTGSTATRLAALPTPVTRSTPHVCGVSDYPVAPIFAPSLLWAVQRNHIAIAKDAFRIDLFDLGKPVRTFLRARSRTRASRPLAKRQVGAGPSFQIVGRKPCTVPADMILAVAEIADEIPAYSSIVFAADDEIWATRFTLPGDAAKADVYNTTTGYVGTINLGPLKPVAFLSRTVVASLEKDNDDVPLIVVYSIVRR